MKKSILAASLAAATGLGISQNALADAYAYAYNNIFNLQITSSTGIIPASAVFRLDNSAILTGAGAGVDLNGQSFSGPAGAPFDIADANVNIASTNATTPNGFIGPNYARGDAAIVTSELNPGSPPTVSGNLTNIWAVAESYLSTPATGQGSGTVGSVSTFQFIALDPDTTLNFKFDAILDLLACVDGPPKCAVSPASFPTNAKAASGVSFVITNSLGTKVFDWAPGAAPTIGNSTTVASTNPFSLNTNVGRDQSNTGIAQLSLNTTTLAIPQQFQAQTVSLAAGTYTLSLNDNKSVTTELFVPEPATLALMGLGLLGGFAVKRRKIETSGKTA